MALTVMHARKESALQHERSFTLIRFQAVSSGLTQRVNLPQGKRGFTTGLARQIAECFQAAQHPAGHRLHLHHLHRASRSCDPPCA